MNRYDLPMEDGDDGAFSALAVVPVVACIAMVLISIAVSGHAIFKILETTPFMGIPVDASGNRIPIQGYPQLGFGLVGVVVFTVFAFAPWSHILKGTHFSLRTLLIATALVAVVLGLWAWYGNALGVAQRAARDAAIRDGRLGPENNSSGTH